jgi:hypothetical protein
MGPVYYYCVTGGTGVPALKSWIISIGYELAWKWR